MKDLPAEVTAARLAEEFSRFGPLRGGVRGVNLKAQKDKATFAFIEFEADTSARAAIAAQVRRGRALGRDLNLRLNPEPLAHAAIAAQVCGGLTLVGPWAGLEPQS